MPIQPTALSAHPVLPTLTCIICCLPTDAKQATAGSLYEDGRLAVACTVHLRERRAWFTAWCTFDLTQRQEQDASLFHTAGPAV